MEWKAWQTGRSQSSDVGTRSSDGTGHSCTRIGRSCPGERFIRAKKKTEEEEEKEEEEKGDARDENDAAAQEEEDTDLRFPSLLPHPSQQRASRSVHNPGNE